MSTARLLGGLVGLLMTVGGAAAAPAASPAAASAVLPAMPAGGAVYMPVGDATNAPIGWKQFCQTYQGECDQGAQEARDVVLSPVAWHTLTAINDRVNHTVEPMTDLDHYGKEEWWAFPDDGKGDCEDYVLQKRRLLLDAGWPRSALLITVVRDHRGDGHAVLTVKTDRGEYVLDNQEDDVLAWQDTGYRYVKRQSQENQNTWVWLGDRLPTPLVAAK